VSALAAPDVSAGMRRLIASEVLSSFGSMLSRLAMAWIAALFLDATPIQMAWLVIADVIAGALGTLLIGGWVDRHSRRMIMMLADGVRAAFMAGVVLLYLFDALSFWMLVVQSAMNGLAAMVFSIARSAWIADNVPNEGLTLRNSQMSAASSSSEAVAFGGGGWLFQLFGPVAALVTDTLSYIGSAWFLRGIPERLPDSPIPARAKTPWFSDVASGFHAVRASSVLKTLVVSDVLMTLSFSITSTVYMIFVTRDLAVSTGVQGLIFATGALGSLAGAAMAPSLGRKIGAGRSLAVGLLAAGIGAVCIPLAPSAAVVVVVLLVTHQIVGDTGSVIAMIHGRTLRQLHAPKGSRGRVDAAMRSVSQGITVVGALAGGLFASAIGTREALWVGAICLLLGAVLMWLLLSATDARETSSTETGQ